MNSVYSTDMKLNLLPRASAKSGKVAGYSGLGRRVKAELRSMMCIHRRKQCHQGRVMRVAS